MREFLASGQVGNIELNEQKRIRKEINERWSALGMVDGLKGIVKENIATLYENEAKALLSEATASDNSGSFETVVFPIIRRVFSKLLANDIVSVQAMNLPVGKLFFMLPVTSEREWDYLDENGRVKSGYEDRANFIITELNKAYGLEIEMVDGVSLGVPAVISKRGVAMIVPIHMNDIEKKEFLAAARTVKEATDEVFENIDIWGSIWIL